MRILIVNTSESAGGAAVAANRLAAALNNNGEKATMLVRDKSTDSIIVGKLPCRRVMRLKFLWERFVIFVHLLFRKKHLWEIDIANTGADITSLAEFKEADVIHLSWINQSMLSLSDIGKIIRSGKPVVWTMHDLWPASAICHYAGGCRKFTVGCANCPLLPFGGGKNDIAAKVWKRKKHIYRQSNIWFVACSRWLEKQAKQSALLEGMELTSIPNPIDTNVFRPSDKLKAKESLGLPTDKKVILFVAQKVTDTRKGAAYLVEALQKLVSCGSSLAEQCAVALLGGSSDELAQLIPMPVFPLGYVSGDRELARVYNAADVFVLPSMQDNLPNTLMEALACGVPCVGFSVGGIPEMIDHRRNGYVAREADADDLADGLQWVLQEADAEELKRSATAKVAKNYSQTSVAMRYIDVYSEAMAQKRYLR
jgi:glycosyltransferase involved in cell wall biosynthesis